MCQYWAAAKIFQVLLNIVAAVDKGWFKVISILNDCPSLSRNRWRWLLLKSLLKDFWTVASFLIVFEQLPVLTNDGKGGKVVSKAEVFYLVASQICLVQFFSKKLHILSFQWIWSSDEITSKYYEAGLNSRAWGSQGKIHSHCGLLQVGTKIIVSTIMVSLFTAEQCGRLASSSSSSLLLEFSLSSSMSSSGDTLLLGSKYFSSPPKCFTRKYILPSQSMCWSGETTQCHKLCFNLCRL